MLCTDQQRFSALGAAGNPEIQTPNLDRLAAQGALFENCYVQSPVCAPSRASLMTGRYLHNHGLWANGVALRETEQVVAEPLTAAGYDCGLVGKYHLAACADGRTEQPPPGMRVFRWAHDPYPRSSENAYHRYLQVAHPEIYGQLSNGTADFDWDSVPTQAHYSRWIGDETRRYLTSGRADNQPFFFIANFFDPHHGFGAPAEYLARYHPDSLSVPIGSAAELETKPDIYTEASKESYAGHARGFTDYTAAELQQVKAAYYAMVSLVDDEVGGILATLEAEGLADDTLVIFTSDHGEMLGDHQLMLKGPMMYDCAVRVPLILRWPGRIQAGRRVDDLVQWIDLTSTFLDLAGADLPGAQGQSLLPLATGSGPAVRDWALCEYRNSGHPYDPPVHTTMLRRGASKIVVHHGAPSSSRARQGELYDLAADPDELVNHWDDPAYAGERQQMTELLLDVLVATEDRSQPRHAVW
nr:sulfatase-like hydrolase/transferase [Microlunatus panaciterrae]